MKIFYVNKTRLYDNMPSTVFSMLNAYGFAENGADVTIILKEPLSNIDHDFESFFNLKKLNNFQIISISDKKFGFRSNEIFYANVNRWTKSQSKPDVILTRDPGYLPFQYKLKKQLKVKTFYQSHNYYLDTSLQPDQKKTNQQKFHKYEHKYIPELDGLFTLNPSQKELYQQYISIPIYAVIPGLQQLYKQQDNFDKKTIVYSGSLQMMKGVDVLLKAFAHLETKEAKLVLIGGRHAGEIEPVIDLAKKLNIYDQIEITGWLSFHQVNEHLAKATVGVIPLKDTFYNRYLTAPSKLFDYIAHGIPVVASELPAIKEIDTDGHHLLYTTPEDVEKLAGQIDMLLQNSELYHQYSAKSYDLAKNYLWKDCSQRMLEKFL